MSIYVTGTATAGDFRDLIQVLTTFPGEAHRAGAGSRDDLVAFGDYDSGAWTLEIRRPLFTGNAEDYQFVSSLLMGDANNDLRFDAADVVTVVNHVNGTPITDPQLLANADTDGDDDVDTMDLAQLVNQRYRELLLHGTIPSPLHSARPCTRVPGHKASMAG